MGGDAESLDRVGNLVAGAHDVADAQAGGQFNIDLAGEQLCRTVEVVGTQAGVTHGLPAGLEGLSGRVGDGLDGDLA